MNRFLPIHKTASIRLVKDGAYSERPVVASIAGHLDSTLEECAPRMIDQIDNAMKLGHHFVISNNGGKINPFHSMLMRVLSTVPERLTVLYLQSEPVYASQFKQVRGLLTEQDRIRALVQMADYDILYYPSIKFSTGEGRHAIGRLVATERERYLSLGDRPRYENMHKRPDLELKNDLFMIQMEMARRERNQGATEASSTLEETHFLLPSLEKLA